MQEELQPGKGGRHVVHEACAIGWNAGNFHPPRGGAAEQNQCEVVTRGRIKLGDEALQLLSMPQLGQRPHDAGHDAVRRPPALLAPRALAQRHGGRDTGMDERDAIGRDAAVVQRITHGFGNRNETRHARAMPNASLWRGREPSRDHERDMGAAGGECGDRERVTAWIMRVHDIWMPRANDASEPSYREDIEPAAHHAGDGRDTGQFARIEEWGARRGDNQRLNPMFTQSDGQQQQLALSATPGVARIQKQNAHRRRLGARGHGCR